MTIHQKSREIFTNVRSFFIPSVDDSSPELLGDQFVGLFCLVAASVHFVMVVTSQHVVDAGIWERLSLLVVAVCYGIWRLRWKFPAADHLSLSRKISRFLALWVCFRWLAIWMSPNPDTLYINVVSGLLYMPLLLACLNLLSIERRTILLVTICFIVSPILFSNQILLRLTPFRDWRLSVSLAGFYLVFSYLLSSILSLKAQVSKLTASNVVLGHTAMTDSLTQLLNRRGFENLRQRFNHQNSGIIMLDVDHFKFINDTLGHDIGDAVLAALASTIQQVTRTEDLVSRWGGEEFLLMVGLNKDGREAEALLFQLATKILAVIKDFNWNQVHSELKTVTVSAGIIVVNHDIDFRQALIAADLAMLNAKRNGRDQVHIGEIEHNSKN